MAEKDRFTKNPTKFRKAVLSDLSAIVALERDCSTAAHWTEQHYLEALAGDGPERLVLVAESTADPHLILGFLAARHIAREWELENIVVAGVVRRTGIGHHLLDTFLKQAAESGGSSVFLEVRESNHSARSFYEKAGFRECGRRKLYYANPPEDAILCRRALASELTQPHPNWSNSQMGRD